MEWTVTLLYDEGFNSFMLFERIFKKNFKKENIDLNNRSVDFLVGEIYSKLRTEKPTAV